MACLDGKASESKLAQSWKLAENFRRPNFHHLGKIYFTSANKFVAIIKVSIQID